MTRGLPGNSKNFYLAGSLQPHTRTHTNTHSHLYICTNNLIFWITWTFKRWINLGLFKVMTLPKGEVQEENRKSLDTRWHSGVSQLTSWTETAKAYHVSFEVLFLWSQISFLLPNFLSTPTDYDQSVSQCFGFGCCNAGRWLEMGESWEEEHKQTELHMCVIILLKEQN